MEAMARWKKLTWRCLFPFELLITPFAVGHLIFVTKSKKYGRHKSMMYDRWVWKKYRCPLTFTCYEGGLFYACESLKCPYSQTALSLSWMQHCAVSWFLGCPFHWVERLPRKKETAARSCWVQLYAGDAIIPDSDNKTKTDKKQAKQALGTSN